MNKNKKPTHIFIFSVALFLIYFLIPHITLALEIDYPAIRFPGGVFDLNSAFEVGKLTIESLVIYVYAIFLILAGIIAFISLTRAGFVFIYSGGNPTKRAEAKKRFFSVLVGLFILVFSFTFLNILNPDIVRIDEPILLKDPGVTGSFNCKWNDFTRNCEVGIINCATGYEVNFDICKTSNLNACKRSINNPCVSPFSFGGISSPIARDSGTFSCMWNGSNCTLIEPTNCKTGFTTPEDCEVIEEEIFCDSTETYSCNYIGTFNCTWDGGKCVTGINTCSKGFNPDVTRCTDKDIDSCELIIDLSCV